MLAWLPYADENELVSRIGPLPTGVTFEPVDRHEPNGPSIDKVEFFVLPYLTGAKTLARVGEMTSLQVIQTQTAGYESVIDLVPGAVALCNGAGIHDTATAEMALALALRITILGYGHIGKSIESRVAAFEPASITKVASRARDDIHGTDELAELLPRTDVLFVIAPLTPQTEGLLDAAALALLPDNALVVNVARGKIIDTDALVAETTSGRLRAALDVTDPEPLPQDHPLWTIPGVTISPHVGGASSAFHPRADAVIKAQLHRWAAGEPLENIVKPAEGSA